MYSSIEKITKNELRELQIKRLRETINRVYGKSAYFRKKLNYSNVNPSDISKIEDLSKIPFFDKSDLRANYPIGLVIVSLDQIVRFHVSSGTTGNPTVVGYTERDIENWTQMMARCLSMMGVRKGSVVQNSYGYGLFTGGLGIHYGAEKLGAVVIPTSTGNTKRQIKIMKDMNTTVLTCTPSYALLLAETLAKEGIDPEKDLKLQVGVFGAEPWSESTRDRIHRQLHIEPFDLYGLSELYGPGVAAECPQHNGLHIWADHFIPEVIDPKTGEVLEPGNEGELVFTAITKEAMPLIRYRTRDITRLEYDTCECGRTYPRLMRIKGRSDDMMIVKGVNVFPSQIEYVLESINELGEQYQIILTKSGPMDDLKVKVESRSGAISDPGEIVQLKKKVQSELYSVLNFNIDVELVEPGSLPRSEGKANRVLDMRGI